MVFKERQVVGSDAKGVVRRRSLGVTGVQRGQCRHTEGQGTCLRLQEECGQVDREE